MLFAGIFCGGAGFARSIIKAMNEQQVDCAINAAMDSCLAQLGGLS